MSWTARIASLVPGRAHGELERDPARSAGDKVLLLRQDQLGEIAVRPAGVVLMEAGPFSHALIQWLGREVPTGLVEADQTIQWKDREPVLLDSARGEVRPLAAEETPAPWSAPAAPTPGEPIATRDGISVRLTASVGGAPGARRAVVAGAAAIGLVRSEYLLPDDGAMPSAAFYRSSLSALLEAAAPLEVTVRLLDLGADKWPPWVSRGRHGAALHGLHGSRLHAHSPVRGVVDAQLAAVRYLGAAGRLHVLRPSGGRLDEFMRWRDGARSALPSSVPVGAMVETPIEMLALDRWGTEADFVAVGCNDLLSHLSGAARDDPRLNDLLDPYRPELFRFLEDAAGRAGSSLERLRLCGVLPQVEGVLPILIGLGFREFSGETALIPLLARQVSRTTLGSCRDLAETVCAAPGSRAVRELVGAPIAGPWGLVTDRANAPAREA